MTQSFTHSENESQYFFELTPERVLAAVEASGLECTGRCLTLNSFENRVYDIELEDKSRRIAKFYRPGRWSEEQILEEHQFLQDLQAQEIPVIAPTPFPDQKTLHCLALNGGVGIWYAIFPKVGGRAPEEFTDEQLLRVGRLLGRIHNVGASRTAPHRMALTPTTYGRENLEFLITQGHLPREYEEPYRRVVEKICAFGDEAFSALRPDAIHRVHGDCHPGNLLWNDQGPFFLDFDDMVRAPAAQDLWMIVPGRDSESLRQREVLLEGYQEMRDFDRSTLRLIEILRALRFVHYSTWIARRWQDPAFPQAFPEFGSHSYWADEIQDLQGQLDWIDTARG